MNQPGPQQQRVQLQKLRNYLRHKPEDDNAWLVLATLQQNLGMLDDAAVSAERASRINSANPNHSGVLAEIRFRQGRFDESINAATRAIKLDDKLLAARGIRGEAYRLSGRFERALADFQKVKIHQPDNPELLNKIGTCLVRLEDFDTAEQHFTRAVELNPQFTVARLNLGLLCATQLKSEEAIERLGSALEDKHLAPAARQSAQATLEILLEHQRLQPFLDEVLNTGNMVEFQYVLDQAPAALTEPDPKCVADLRNLAALCMNFEFNPDDFGYSHDTHHLPFIQACSQVRIEKDADVMAALYAKITSGDEIAGFNEQDMDIIEAWRRNRDRLDVSAQQLHEEQGEAWLRYWHGRVMASDPEKQPGHFKAIPNTVGKRRQKLPVQPAAVAGTIKILLHEIALTVPEGVARGVFMYIAICMVHAFNDGNGRLARFLMAWEFENAGMPALITPEHLQFELRQGLDKALLNDDLKPIYAVLRQGHVETDRLLGQFNDIIGAPKKELD